MDSGVLACGVSQWSPEKSRFTAEGAAALLRLFDKSIRFDFFISILLHVRYFFLRFLIQI